MNYDTFYTIMYKGHFIMAKSNRTLKREEFATTIVKQEYYSLLSAKRAITKQLKGNIK